MVSLGTGKTVSRLQQLLKGWGNSKFLTLNSERDIIDRFQLTPIGEMLKNNLRDEFVRGDGETAVYEGGCGLSLNENLQFVKDAFSVQLPFGIVTEKILSNETIPINESIKLKLPTGSNLSRSYFVSPSSSREYMYKTQRQRKIWWMRYACDPGRFFISDPQQDNHSRGQSTTIQARLGGEEVTLEQIELIPGSEFRDELGDFHVEIGRSGKPIIPDVIRIRQCVELATLQILLDAYEVGGSSSVRIHRKLAPFKCGIVCLVEGNASQMNELYDLAKHLCSVLRRSNVTVLDCTNVSETVLAKQLHNLDAMGVPFSLILRLDSLSNGLFQLRSRDTTISETIHITDLPQYLLQIITN
ncbi:DNA polymerase subunit gamma-2, mitochondrial [Wyeomyia smithii]|uniref:DNA polymerase subunit gamma-2, mitochondrial n=1 Tax=Wyeomyia smithii TaxID=174621 RepID=UPI00246814A1|nr:DNA polymerase subunit gamma-2, mitochondrial [Wyeomyia smithii]